MGRIEDSPDSSQSSCDATRSISGRGHLGPWCRATTVAGAVVWFACGTGFDDGGRRQHQSRATSAGSPFRSATTTKRKGFARERGGPEGWCSSNVPTAAQPSGPRSSQGPATHRWFEATRSWVGVINGRRPRSWVSRWGLRLPNSHGDYCADKTVCADAYNAHSPSRAVWRRNSATGSRGPDAPIHVPIARQGCQPQERFSDHTRWRRLPSVYTRSPS